MKQAADPELSSLGKPAGYDPNYDAGKLFAIARATQRLKAGIPDSLPFVGFDLWNHYEVSWLNAKGKPQVAIAQISYACDSKYMIESKSMKLYFHSFNNTRIVDVDALLETVSRDLSACTGSPVTVKIFPLEHSREEKIVSGFQGLCLDTLDIECDIDAVTPAYLSCENETVSEEVWSNLLKSNCLVTRQPDWGSVQIVYSGKKINHAGLLRYIVSYRNHNEFHEQCVERIFMDIMRVCQPESLAVHGRYTRRGGLDINPWRATPDVLPPADNFRLCRQ